MFGRNCSECGNKSNFMINNLCGDCFEKDRDKPQEERKLVIVPPMGGK